MIVKNKFMKIGKTCGEWITYSIELSGSELSKIRSNVFTSIEKATDYDQNERNVRI